MSFVLVKRATRHFAVILIMLFLFVFHFIFLVMRALFLFPRISMDYKMTGLETCDHVGYF